jgi:hypothetical protein
MEQMLADMHNQQDEDEEKRKEMKRQIEEEEERERLEKDKEEAVFNDLNFWSSLATDKNEEDELDDLLADYDDGS